MINQKKTERYKVIVVGAGQAGLSVGYYLSKLGIPFLILDEKNRVGDNWRNRWETLRLFTPAKFDGLAGMRFPAPSNYFPAKDEMADFLEYYANHFDLPVRSNVKVDRLTKEGDSYCIKAGSNYFQSEHVVVAMSSYQKPKIPAFAGELNPDIVQLHSVDYRDPSQFREGGVLVVGAGNSGCEIALEASKNNHQVWLSGRDVGNIPFHIESAAGKLLLIRLVVKVLFHLILTTNTPIGRKVRPKLVSMGGPLIRIKPKEIDRAGIERVEKLAGVSNGLPVLKKNKVLDAKNVVWATGFYPSFSWIDIPVFNGDEPVHNRGVVKKERGLYFVGLHFLYSLSSDMIHGVNRDSKHVVDTIAKRLRKQN